MSDRRKEAEEKMAKAIFISADCWLSVFDLLPAYQLGLGISMISHRFDFYVDEHFKTRKWTLALIRIRNKIGENGTDEMEIINFGQKALPIPPIQLPRKVSGFQRIEICFIDQNAIAFLCHFRQLFAACPINLVLYIHNDCISELILRNTWPMLGKNIHFIELPARIFRLLRQFAPSALNDCPSLRVVSFFFDDIFPEFPADDNATASDGQVLAKWLFTPLQNGVPKVLICQFNMDDANWMSRIEAFQAAFASASSTVNFIVVIWFPSYFDDVDFVVPFEQINEMTREQLALKLIDDCMKRMNINNQCFVLVRCPIARDESKWTKWEKEAIHWCIYDEPNQIFLLTESDQQK
ncbi:hypothetical protein niasHT_032926 [Heterodera trifolii]|uniref:Uncharacterized protein n=1 Tax=Heterodera trifolii TaxID=157864 RepID=A0ABD2J4K5_9BILA